MPSDLLLGLTILVGLIALVGGALIWILGRKGRSFRLTDDELASEQGLAEIGRRAGLRSGMAGNTVEHSRSEAPPADESAPGAGDDLEN